MTRDELMTMACRAINIGNSVIPNMPTWNVHDGKFHTRGMLQAPLSLEQAEKKVRETIEQTLLEFHRLLDEFIRKQKSPEVKAPPRLVVANK